MKLAQRLLFPAILALSIASCTKQPQLDASTPKALKASAEIVRTSLPEAKRSQFDSALTMIVVATLDPMQTLNLASQGTLPTEAGTVARLKPAIHGLNATDIIELGKQSTEKVEERLASWKTQYELLQQQSNAAQTVAARAAKLRPISANLRTINTATPIFGDNQVQVDVTLQNDLQEPVTDVQFDLALMPPSVANPWVVQPFTHKFDAPIAPGATATVSVGPIAVNVPDVYKGPVQLDADIRVNTVGLQGKPAIKVPKWDQVNEIHLAKLQTSIAEVTDVMFRVSGLPK